MKSQKLIIQDDDPDVQAAMFVKHARKALERQKPNKTSISIRLHTDVIEFLESISDGKYQPAINTILRAFVEYPVDKLPEALADDDSLPDLPKKPVSIRLDKDLFATFKEQGKGYQTRINQALRVFLLYSKASSGGYY
ncbi:hypothetical protein SYK_27990 [Pseudodesulfovibrio nedwellii]|uniref:BrnA antitoxin family protein n=1 Tax=Pseudodesulfovibrio nedwellii TaxID=2973072 RepID=A0ABN6S813_9BACT|nr:BrnA antitoxin family protein [Pseudodesulfovibrio nedwellii]BDQ38439.1 hypothetical protein SYK_27990 [Pseudodesulfovibrio nedwellii]